MSGVVCRGGRTCSTPATHAQLERWPGPLEIPEGWEPLCWSHAIEGALQAGHASSRYTVTLCSIGYALEDSRPLVRYVDDAGRGRAGYVVIP